MSEVMSDGVVSVVAPEGWTVERDGPWADGIFTDDIPKSRSGDTTGNSPRYQAEQVESSRFPSARLTEPTRRRGSLGHPSAARVFGSPDAWVVGSAQLNECDGNDQLPSRMSSFSTICLKSAMMASCRAEASEFGPDPVPCPSIWIHTPSWPVTTES